jgi:hypothetical protein
VLYEIRELLILVVLGDPKKEKKNQNQRTGGFHERTIQKKQPF